MRDQKQIPGLVLVFAALCAAQDRGLTELASSLGTQIKQRAKGPVAVTSFVNANVGNYCPAFSIYLVDRLTILLVRANADIDVVTRDRVEEVFKEINLTLAKNYDSSTFAKVGHQLGAKSLVRGSYTIEQQGAIVSVAAQLLDVETGRVIGGDLAELPLTSDLKAILDSPACVANDSSRSVPVRVIDNADSGRESRSPPRTDRAEGGIERPFGTKRAGQLDVTLKTCRIDPEGLICEALVTNLGEERQYCLASKADSMMSRIVDDKGNVKTPIRISLADKVGPYQMWECAILPKGVAVASALLFVGGNRSEAKLPEEGSRLRLVEFGFDIVNYSTRSPTSFFAQFRDVPVSR
jgi:TolB-like protein